MKKTCVYLLMLTILVSLSACGNTSTQQAAPSPAAQTPAPDNTEAAAPVSTPEADMMTMWEPVEEEGMVPLYADSLKDGVYPAQVRSSSPMFQPERCELTVSDGTMTAALYMTSEASLYLFPGSAEDAEAADEAAYIPLMNGVFLFPVEALDKGLPCAVFSRKNEQWYDRTLLFRADSIPVDAYADGVLMTPAVLALADGEYTVDVSLKGGSGKARVSSPARLIVEAGVCTAEIIWSSSHYDYVRISEETYYPVNTEGNAVFMLPVSVFDFNMAILADTTAMSQPHEIAYFLRFDSETIRPADK